MKITTKKINEIIEQELLSVLAERGPRSPKTRRQNRAKNRIRVGRSSPSIPKNPKSAYMKVMAKLKPIITKVPSVGPKVYIALTSASLAAGGYKALKAKAHNLGYTCSETSYYCDAVLKAVSEKQFFPNTQFEMIKALLVWARDEGILSMIPGYDEVKYLSGLIGDMEVEPYGGAGGR